MKLWLNPESECQFNPQPKHIYILNEALRPEPEVVKKIDICCGIGFGKTTLLIILAIMKLESSKKTRILFLQPDSKRISQVFWPEWRKWAPPDCYRVKNKGTEIHWRNGAIIDVAHRWITGNQALVADGNRGPNLTDIFDDEAAINFNMEFYQNGEGRLRVPGQVCSYITATTPKVGPYGELLSKPGHRLIHGRTSDNAANLRPGFEAELRASFTEMHARRELDGEMVALEGRVWQSWDDSLNMSSSKFVRGKPYCLAGDIGVMSSWLIIQKYDNADVIVGQALFDDGGTRQDIDRIVRKFGRPSKIITGGDLGTTSQVSGTTSVIEIKNALRDAGLGYNLPIVYPALIDTIYTDKGIQYHALDTIIERRKLQLSSDCVILGNKTRSFIKMIQQDAWPEPGKAGWFVKDKLRNRKSAIEDTRDSAMYYAVCEYPPRVSSRAA